MARRTAEEEAQAAAEGEEATETEESSKSKKDPMPAGWDTPVQFAKALSVQRAGIEVDVENFKEQYAALDESQRVAPQGVYVLFNNNAKLREASKHTNHTDGRQMVHIPSALAFMAERDERLAEQRAARAAKKAAEEAEGSEEAEAAEAASE